MLKEKKKTLIRPVSSDYEMSIDSERENMEHHFILNQEELKAYVRMAMAHSKHYYVTTGHAHQGEINITDEGYINFYPAIIMDHEIIEFDEMSKNLEEVIETVNNVALFKNSFVTRNGMLNGNILDNWDTISESVYEDSEIRNFMIDVLEYSGYHLDSSNEELLLHSFIKSCPNHISNETWTKSYQKRK